MSILFIIGAVILQAVYSSSESEGAGSFSYSDSSGKRYGGTYGLKDGKVVNTEGTFPPNFSPQTFHEQSFPDFDDFFPEYFRNLENILQDVTVPFIPQSPFISSRRFITRPPTPIMNPFNEVPFGPFIPPQNIFDRAFQSSIDNQRLAFQAAQKAYDVTSNQAGFNAYLNPGFVPFQPYSNYGHTANFNVPRYPMGSFPPFPHFDPSNAGPNSAFASAVAGPNYRQQIAAINPMNPLKPNVKVTRYDEPNPGPGQYSGISVSSVSTSSNVNGKTTSSKKASTLVNNNGKITAYEVSD